MSRLHPVLISTAVLLLATGGGPHPASGTLRTQQVPGRLVIIGGALAADNDRVYEAVLAGRDGDGPICVLPTASGAPRESMESAVSRLDANAGSSVAEGVLLTVENAAQADSPALADRLRRCSGFFFTGGSQSRILDVFRPSGRDTPAYEALMDRWRSGAVVAGTSAGAAMMSSRVIAGGSSSGALEQGIGTEEDGGGVRVRSGMGFVPWAVVDQHFLARGRWGRLLATVVQDPGVELGIGIDENTALVVDGDQAEVVGASGVVWLDGRDAVLDSSSRAGHGLTLRLLGAGDRVDIPSAMVVRGSGKQRLPRASGGVEPPGDPFDRWAFLHLLVAFSVSDESEVTLAGTDWRITLSKPAGFEAADTGPGGVEGTPAGLSVGPIRLSLERR